MNTTESGANQPEGETVVTVDRTNRAGTGSISGI